MPLAPQLKNKNQKLNTKNSKLKTLPPQPLAAPSKEMQNVGANPREIKRMPQQTPSPTQLSLIPSPASE